LTGKRTRTWPLSATRRGWRRCRRPTARRGKHYGVTWTRYSPRSPREDDHRLDSSHLAAVRGRDGERLPFTEGGRPVGVGVGQVGLVRRECHGPRHEHSLTGGHFSEFLTFAAIGGRRGQAER